jgi:hypothetical protein
VTRSYYLIDFRIHHSTYHNIDTSLSTDFIRRLVMDLMVPYFGSGRILNTDNWYSSPQLCAILKTKGIYSRGTLRVDKKHVPPGIHFTESDKSCRRGSFKVMGCESQKLFVASWVDRNVVMFVSNADPSHELCLMKRYDNVKSRVNFEAPFIAKMYQM